MEIPIKQAILGEWKLVDYENWEDAEPLYNSSFDEFSENLKFELVDGGRMKVSGGGEGEILENGNDILFVEGEGDHLKSVVAADFTEDYFIENGRLYFVLHYNGNVWKRIYEKIPIKLAVIGDWKMVDNENFEGAAKRCWTFENFSQNLRFQLIDGKLKMSGAGEDDRFEGPDEFGRNNLFLEDDHLKSMWPSGSTDDVYIHNGRLHYVENSQGIVYKRIYEKM